MSDFIDKAKDAVGDVVDKAQDVVKDHGDKKAVDKLGADGPAPA